MKTMGLILIVVALHCAVVGSVFFISGCGTTPPAETTTMTPDMPAPTPPKAQPETALPQPPPAKEAKTTGGGEYIVQPGDSLAKIAKLCHVTQAELMAANQLADPNKLKAGQKLILPATGQLPAAAPKPAALKAKAKPETVKAGESEYVVKPGDNLSKIAAHYGIKVSVLREANKLTSDTIKIGQKLKIPEAGAVAPAAPAAGAAAKVAVSATAPDSFSAAAAPLPPPAAAKGTELAPAAGAAGKSDVVSGSGIVHVVQPNEDLISVAKLYAVTVEEIVEINQLSTNRSVHVGQRLKIP